MKKTMMILLAVVLIVAISVTGTLAWLTKATDPVTNTFVAGKLLEEDLILKEHEVVRSAETGNYDYKQPKDDSTLVTKNTYTVVPGATLPKDPFVKFKNIEDAYLFIEVKGEALAGFNWSVDSMWTEATGITGPNGGKMYVLADGAKVAGGEHNYNILKDNQITTTETFDPSTLTANNNLSFYAYLAQASGFDNYKAAWDAAKFPVAP